MTKENSIELKNITVSYRSYKERPTSLKESVIQLITKGKLKHYSTFNALENVSLNVKRGEVFALIGSNGAGKSTFLKVLAGVLKPTKGSVNVDGSVASLIELGVGFDMELNAVENIYLNGSLYRRPASVIKERVDDILDFAELKEFQNTPIKYYSSGMTARLGFAAAIDINPDILLVDEILAVGDERFQLKCQGVFDKLLNSGKTIVIVTHNLEMAKARASRIGLMSRGKLVYVGDPEEAVERYRNNDYETVLGQTVLR